MADLLSEEKVELNSRSIRPGTAQARSKSASRSKSLPDFLRAQNLAFNLSLATAAIAILAVGSWLVLETRRLRTEVEQLRAGRQQLEEQTVDARARADQFTQELERERGQREQLQTELQNPPAKHTIVSFILIPGIARGEEEATKLVVPRDARLVRLDLYLQGPAPYKSYTSELRTAGGKPVWSRDGLTARQTRTGRAVGLSLPASTLTSGKYETVLRGVVNKEQSEAVGYYYFNIVRK